MTDNPVRRYREINYLTQAELASKAGCSPQVILLCEQGVYTTLPPAIKRITHSTNEAYHNFQVSVRQTNKEAFEEAIVAFDIGPVAAHPHATFRLLVTDSFIGYCKMLAIAPQIVRNYERRLSNPRLHPLIRQYLKDAGISEGMLNDLGARFENSYWSGRKAV